MALTMLCSKCLGAGLLKKTQQQQKNKPPKPQDFNSASNTTSV